MPILVSTPPQYGPVSAQVSETHACTAHSGLRAVMRTNLMRPMLKPRFISGITTAPCMRMQCSARYLVILDMMADMHEAWG